MIATTTDKTNISPVLRVMPVLPAAAIGQPTQDLAFRASQFIKGQDYFAQITAKPDASQNLYHVNVDGTLLRMELGTSAKVGQTLMLKYMSDAPVPTFTLSTSLQSQATSDTHISDAGRLINHYLADTDTQAKATFQANVVVTHTPQVPALMAHGLKQALTNSGLFYESHLADYMQGGRDLSLIQQEPQNRHATLENAQSTLVSQQLSILENQRIVWHGEVWPGQVMDWKIKVEDQPSHAEHQATDTESPISSELTLHLPHLGKVTAKIQLVDGRMRIHLQADQAQTMSTLKQESGQLAGAIQNLGQTLAGLTVGRYE
jgi:hypothetical protein